MRVIYLSTPWTLLLCFIVWPVLQVSAALFCLALPNRLLSVRSFFFRTHAFEKGGRIYDRIFRVSRWKHLLPDGGTVLNKNGFRKKHLDSFSEENLTRFLTESVRGELTHWLAILPFWVFGFFAPPEIIWYMLAYAIFANVPCIIAQRYNRPRVERLIAHLQKRHATRHN